MGENSQKTMFAAFIASGIAEIISLPTDIAKTRLQVQKTAKYRGMSHCIYEISRTEGISALWKGWKPALLRQCCYSTLTMILFEKMKTTAFTNEELNYSKRLVCGGVSGALSIFVFNWTEILKTKLQTNPTSNTSMLEVLAKIYKNEGIFSLLFSGLKPNLLRTFIVNAVEFGTYDQAKSVIFIPILGDNSFAHISSSSFAGFCSALVSTPADVIKTRMMNNAGNLIEKNSSVAKAFQDIFKEEGLSALYKGFVPICIRKVLWCSIFFVSYEKIKISV